MPKVSVILPVYNAELYLQEAIDSILKQTFTDWELIIVNDGSADDTEKIIRSYNDQRIRYYKNEKNIGLIETLNKAIDFCTGEYIARMDADDISHSDRFQMQINFLDKNQDCGMCGTYAEIINEKGIKTGEIINLTTNEYLQINLLFSVPFIHPSMIIRKSALMSHSFDADYKHAEDYDLWCRISTDYKIANIPYFLLKYRWHTENISVKNSDYQHEIKSKIIRRQLQNLGLKPNENELFLHTISFTQFDAKEKEVKESKSRFTDFLELDNWFSKIIEANKIKKRYHPNALIAYLWSRWAVVCISQKQYSKILKPKFVPLNISVFTRTVKLIAFLSKKK